MVYYMNGLPQPIMFPAADLYAISGAAAASGQVEFMAKWYPRARFVKPSDGLINEDHIAVIPEYLDTLPSSAVTLKEWPQMWPKESVFEIYPAFKMLIDEPGLHRCKVFQFTEIQRREQLLYFSAYPTKVTICQYRRDVNC